MGITRREFMVAGFAGVANAALAEHIHVSAAGLPLAFSTLGCPGWEWPRILDFAQAEGFAAIELRGLKGDMDLPSRPEFTADKIVSRKRELTAHGLKIACVSSSSAMHESDPAKREKSLADARRFIDLAQALEAPYVRVFGNEIKGSRDEVIGRVAAGLHELAEYAGPRDVTVILESHGDFVDSPTLKDVLTRANSPHAALLWDAHHTFASAHEQPEQTVAELGKWIRHTHLKDSVAAGNDRHYVFTGKGDVPVERQVQALRRIGYKGYFCFEWEKVWHPDLPEPEVAFPDYVRAVSVYLRQPLKPGAGA